MKGSIHSDEKCPVCGCRFVSAEPRGLFCPKHKSQFPKRFIVRYNRITKRFQDYQSALQFLTGLRYQEGSGSFDCRDYQIKAKPLAFDRLADEWLSIKAGEIKNSSWRSLASGIRKAAEAWGATNIKNIQFAQLQDFFKDYPGASKTKANAFHALKQFWAWAVDRYDIPPLTKWPRLGHVEMAFRATVDIPTQEAIINDLKEREPFRVWLCIKWLATYIAIRPGEMRSLTEGQVDRQRGLLIISDQQAKEKRAKIIPLIEEDLEIVRALPLAFRPDMPFFRHECGGELGGKAFGHDQLYRAWKRACSRLSVRGVSLYPGTKHSTAMSLRAVATPEEIKSMTLHSTSAAFHRYFQTSGEALRELQSRRKTLTASDNDLITELGNLNKSQVIDFIKK